MSQTEISPNIGAVGRKTFRRDEAGEKEAAGIARRDEACD